MIATPPRRKWQTTSVGSSTAKTVQARRVGPTERLWRWAKRNPIIATLTAAVAALVSLVAIVALIGYARTNLALAQVSAERQEAQQERDEAVQNLYVAQMRMAQKDWEEGQIQRLRKTLLDYVPAPGQPDLRGWEWYYQLSRCFGEMNTLRVGHGDACSIVWSPDGRQLAIAFDSKSAGLKLWDLETESVVESVPHEGMRGSIFAWHPGEQRIAWKVDGPQQLHRGAAGRERGHH